MSKRRARRPEPAPPPPAAPWYAQPPLWLAAALLFGAALALYWGTLRYPLVFDDHHLTLDGVMSRYGQRDMSFGVRWLSYATYPLVGAIFGPDVAWQRLTNVLLHGATAAVLFGFLARLFAVLLDDARLRWLALLGALWFTVHPVAVYGVAYLMERSIILATLFSLLALRFVLEALERRETRWYVAAAAAYGLALLAKEHAVMVPALAVALAVLVRGMSLELARRLGVLLAVFALLGAAAVMQRRGYLATMYEPFAAESLWRFGTDLANVYPLSILNQTTLFFRYLATWLFPWPDWISIDIRTPFPRRLVSWYVAGFAAWIAYGVVAMWLILRRGRTGLLGFGLLFPWALSLIELSVVRVQEPFVLYRSYLWMSGLPAVLPVLMAPLTQRWRVGILAAASVVLAAGTVARLHTFSNPVELWGDAIAKNTDAYRPRVERGNVNRGLAHLEAGRFEAAAADFERALEINHHSPDAWFSRGTLRLRLGRLAEAEADFDRAIQLDHVYAAAYHKRCVVKAGLGRTAEALVDCERSVLHDPWDDEAWINRGVILRMLGRHAAAEESYQRALALVPGSPSAHYNYGVLLLNTGRRDMATREHFVIACKAGIGDACEVLRRSRLVP